MKLIIAYVQLHKLIDVKHELYKEEVFKLSVTNALGCSQQREYTETYRGVETEVNRPKKVRLEVAVNNSVVARTTDAIIRGARTDSIGDGNIFILDLPECIRSSERGEAAIG